MRQLLDYAGQQLRRPPRRPSYEQEGPESFPGGRGAWPEKDKKKSNCLSHSIPQDSSILIFDFHQARTMEYYKQRFRKNLAQLLEEEAGEQEGEVIGVLCELSIFNLNYLDLGAILGDTAARVQDPTQEALRSMWLSQVL